jgi:RNA polymerase sigma-70 factor (ECF subfamily)
MTRRTTTRGNEVYIFEMPEASVFDGERASEAVLTLRATENALARLPAEQREVILLVCYEELSYAEAAEVLGVPRGTVMSRLSRGRAALAELLGIR